MTEKELRKLNRAELLEMLIDCSSELQTCKERLAEAEKALRNREITINKAGSIAEASLMLNGVFDAAQLACQQYTENIQKLSERQEKVCAQMEAESRAKAAGMIAEAERKRDEMEREAHIQSAEILRKAKAESEKYWEDVSAKLEDFYNAHMGLREMLSFISPQKK